MKKINFLGDSITEGARATSPELTFVSLVGQNLPCIARNFGKGGTRIAPNVDPINDLYGERFIIRAKRMDKDADFVFIFGGTNDFGHGTAPFGNINDTDPKTFYGAVYELLNYLISVYGNEKLCFILPLHCYHENNPLGEGNKVQPGHILAEYKEAINEVCQKLNVECIDFDNVFKKPETKVTDVFVDGLHPNNKGHKILSELVIEYLRKKDF